jgi:hypothetical protein
VSARKTVLGEIATAVIGNALADVARLDTLAGHAACDPEAARRHGCKPEAPARKRRGVARLKVVAQLDRGAPTRGVLELDRRSKTVRVRPLGSRKVYELPAATVASIIVAKVIKADLADAGGKPKRARRLPRRGLR